MALSDKRLCISLGCGGLRACCEHAQDRAQMVEVIDLWAHPDNNHGGDGKGCQFYQTRRELGGDPEDAVPLPRFANKSSRRRFIAKQGGAPLIKPDGTPLIIEAPDLQVSRHIKKGININNPDEE